MAAPSAQQRLQEVLHASFYSESADVRKKFQRLAKVTRRFHVRLTRYRIRRGVRQASCKTRARPRGSFCTPPSPADRRGSMRP